MLPDMPLHFGPYTLAGPQGPLWREAQVVPLPPKALAVLWLLARQAGQVVTKAALLNAVWADTAVSEGVLTVCLSTLRQALEEDAKQPRYLATVHRLGYRFVASVTLGAAPPPQTPSPSYGAPPGPQLVGREAEVAQLHTCFAQAQQGGRQIVWVTGEAGVGKTTVVEAFVHQLGATEALWLGRGQCIEHYGAGEAYLPLLEALGRWGRAPGGAQLVACLRQYAPTWLGHLPALGRPDDLAAEPPAMASVTQARMLRELAEALEALAAERPVVLVLEDLHWSDPSTVEALALLARRRDAARLLVVGTYWPVELILHDHPLKLVKQELAAHGQCVEIPLSWLSPQAVAAYVAQRGGAPAGSADVATFVYQRTEGHPLFMVQVVDYLAQQHLLQAPVQVAMGSPTRAAMAQVVPQGLQQLIEAQAGRLGAEAQQVLEMGSVAGVEFVVASVAAGVQMAPEAVEVVCERLAQQGQFLEERGLVEWPDGTLSGCYGFRHALYQEVFYKRIGSGRRARLHRLIGDSEEAGYGTRASERAAALAMHFVRGGDARRAVPYLRQAAENALEQYAYREAITHLTQALAVLETLPASPERTAHEVAVCLTLGPALIVTRGQVAPDVERTYARAWELCQRLEETPQLSPVLHGLMSFYVNQGPLDRARALAEQQLRIAQRQPDPTLRLVAHTSLGLNLYQAGDFVAARTHLEQGLALVPQSLPQGAGLRHEVVDYGVLGLAHLARTLWKLGYPDQAGQRSQEALRRAQQLAHPHSLGLVHRWTAAFEQLRGDGRAVYEHAEAAVTLATTYEFPQVVALGTLLRGWALATRGQGPEGMAQMQQSLQALQALGVRLGRPYWLALLAEIAGQQGQGATGRQWLTEALATAHRTGERNHEAELYRLQGELLLSQEGPDRAGAAEAFGQALAIARYQQAKSLELRAALSLSRLWQRQGRRVEARELLAPVYGWFTEGFDTADLQEAKALLEDLAG